MKQQVKLTSLAVGFLSCLASPLSFATTSSESQQQSSVQEQQAMLALAAKTDALEKELAELKQQIAQLKKTQPQTNTANTSSPSTDQNPRPTIATASTGQSQQFTAASPEASLPYPESTLSIHTLPTEENGNEGPQSRYYPTALTANGKILTYLAGVPVVTSPFLGARPAFDGSDLIINISKINQDIRLMEQRDMIEQQFIEEGYPVPNTPILMLSGTLQPLFTYQKPYEGSASGNFTLDAVELDTTAIVNPWVEGLASFVYSSAPPAQGGDVTSNSSVSVDKAFVNIGNLSKTPLYMTAGQVYVPFGQYSSNMVSAPLPMIIGRTQVRSAMFGYAPTEDTGFFGTLFTYNSDTTAGNSAAGGGNLVFQFGNEDINGNLGGSLTTNIADSDGMQNTGAGDGEFAGFGANSDNENVSQVGGYDIHGVFNIGPYSFLGEYVSSISPFDVSALSYNGSGAQPMGLNAEAARTFKFFHKPATIAVGYGWTDQALALLIPKQRISATLNVSWWRDTVESLEFRHDIDYSSSDYASGIGATTNTVGTGSSSNTVSALLAVYF